MTALISLLPWWNKNYIMPNSLTHKIHTKSSAKKNFHPQILNSDWENWKKATRRIWWNKTFYPSAHWARRGIVVPFVHRRLRCRPPYSAFWHYTNMVQQIEFIQTFNPGNFFFKGQGHRFEQILVNAIIIGSFKFFVELPMSMEMTWLHLHLCTEYQNGRHLATNFSPLNFFLSEFPWNLVHIYIGFWDLRVYWHYLILCATENEAMAAILIFVFKSALLTR